MDANKFRSPDKVMHNGRSLREIIRAYDEWLTSEGKEGERPNLGGANFSGADLSEADLGTLNLMNVNLSGANLSGAELPFANLSNANLAGAHLVGANLSAVEMWGANLSGADLSGVWLGGATLCDANLSGTNMEQCVLIGTIFADCDLSSAIGLETAHHNGPSSIGIDTILKSKGKIPEVFLRGAGVPDIWIDYVKALTTNPIEFYSCFISYSHHDEEFVESLYTQLQARSVRCWYFPEDATWGNKVQREIGAGVRLFDKVVVVCSEQSLNSGPVIDEIERALQREDKEKRDVLFPIRIDKYLFGNWANKDWEDAYKARLTSKVIGSFEDWKDHDAFKKNFEKLLKALNRKQPS